MIRLVFCRKYQKSYRVFQSLFPGAVGQDIFENVSEKAWKEWQGNQTMLINEHRLSLMDPDARRFLTQEMLRFFDNEVCETGGMCRPQVDTVSQFLFNTRPIL